MERSPSPEPFREPDGMVTIDLNKQSPILCKRKISEINPKRSQNVVSGLIVILIFCLLSFLTAIFIHLDDIERFSSKFQNKHKKEIPDSPQHLKSEWVDESSIEQQTCGLNFRYQYETQLSVCEKTKTFTDCCHRYLRSNLEEINEACSIIEILNLLSEYQKLFPYRFKRNADNEHTASNSTTEIENQRNSKIGTKKKIQSYLQTLNEPLRKELPDLWNWIENSVLKESSQPKEKPFDKNDNDNAITIDDHNFDKNQGILINNHENRSNIGLDIYPIEASNISNSENVHQQSIFAKNASEHLPKKSNLFIENNESRNHENSSLPLETTEVKQGLPDDTLSQNTHNLLNFQKEYNRNVISLPKYITSKDDEPKTPAEIYINFFSYSNPSNEKNQHSFLVYNNENTFEPSRLLNKLDRVSIKRRKKRYTMNEIYSEYNFPSEDQSLPIDEYSGMENNYGNYNQDQNNEYKNQYGQNEEEAESSNGYSYEGIPQDSKLGTPVSDPSSKEEEHYSNEMNRPSLSEEKNFESETELTTFMKRKEELQNQSRNVLKMRGKTTGNFKKTDPHTATSTNKTSVERSSEKISTDEIMHEDSTHGNSKKHEIVNGNPRGNGPSFKGVSIVSSTEQKDALKEFTSTTSSDLLDATDSIQSINQIQANNESIRVDFENTTIILAERKDKVTITTTETSLGDDKIDELSHTSDFRRVSSNLDFRVSPQQGDFVPKTKGSRFPGSNDDVQSIQNNLVNTCMHPPTYTLGSPYKYAVAYDSQFLNVLPSDNIHKPSPIYVINPSVFSYIPPSPIVPHYGSTNQNYNPYGIVNPMVPLPNTNNIGQGSVQVTGASGQYYLCNPIPAPTNGNAVVNVPGVEIRREVEKGRMSKLQRTSNVYTRNMFRNRTRAALECPMEEQSCLDGSKCISGRHVCDNEVHCEDGSDEMFCSCRDRIGEIRLCDGYYDCPDGEDEKGCFGCAEDEISCDDWSRFRKGTCVPIEQRCDGVRNCDVTGKDEDDCSILTDHMGESNPIKVSNAVGFLHRNFKGKWYPTCFGSELWAMDVCKTEAGPSNSAPKSHLVPISENYNGEFINILSNREMGLVDSCVQGRGAFVECPPLFCGLRMTVKNPYRPQEVDTNEDLDLSRNIERVSNGTPHHIRDFVLGNERVVGGKASQPAAWPWVVSIYKNGIFHCGGVIISELWVVTAAHCVDKYWLFYYEVQAGILRRFSYSPMEQSRWVVAAIAHEEYNKSNLKNDIALLKLSSPVRYNRYVRPICLPSEATAGQDFLRGPSPGTICTTVGWGAIMEHGTDPDHMREVQVPILKRCKHPEDEEGNEICAGLFEGGKDACQGDSGGPFMCQNPNNPSQWYLSGIVSHGEGCARPNEPGVYTRVSEYIGWIADNIREDNFFLRTPLEKCPGYVCKDINKCIPRKRRCDKFVDCLLGDDESNCENNFHNIFKHSRIFQPFFRESPKAIEKSRKHSQKTNDDIVLGTAIINAEDESEVTTEALETIIKTDREKHTNKSNLIYKYEKKEYFNNNTDDPDIFRCNKMLQIIPLEKRCNKVFDCEDATDEKNCQCVDYLKLEHPASICDGTVDCIDQSDENICYSCKKNEFNCKISQMCISSSLRCDGIPDCTRSEDELDCVALTNGKTLILDSDFRPNLHMSGIVSVNRFGSWRPYCLPINNKTKSEAEIAAGVCNYLGYEDYTGFKKLYIYNESLVIKSKNYLVSCLSNNGDK
ncbi:hypothetical protein WA026_018066 [Henosepilachna vigintioctopunctata]|uniref:Peptidase S1 domain-containing protein n=1 Tax=Henosepilachna vigintioctopunctata TaxID=420089 RepID=A0AAW1UPG8_9CUCU